MHGVELHNVPEICRCVKCVEPSDYFLLEQMFNSRCFVHFFFRRIFVFDMFFLKVKIITIIAKIYIKLKKKTPSLDTKKKNI